MTNLQGGAGASGAGNGLTRERVLIGAPIVAGGLVALGVLGLVSWPAWQKLQQAERQWQVLKAQAESLPLLRAQLLQTEERKAKVELTQARILRLIAGSGDISTFMAQLNAEAIRTGVQLDSYEPIVEAAPPAGAATTSPPAPAPAGTKAGAKTAPAAPAGPTDPLLAPGLRKTSLLISAKAPTPRLLAFLRRLEQLSLLVVQSDLSLKLTPTPASKPGDPPPPSSTDLRLNLALYSKDAGAPPPSPTPTPAAAPAPAPKKP